MEWRGMVGGAMAVLATEALVVVGALLGGALDMSATGGGDLLDRLGHRAFESWVRTRAPDATLPDREGMVDAGLEHYGEYCVTCHGAVGVPAAGFTGHMVPEPPDLWDPEVRDRSDGELYLVISEGVRMTGMPAFGPDHDPDQIWDIVAAVRRVDALSADQRDRLQGSGGGHHH